MMLRGLFHSTILFGAGLVSVGLLNGCSFDQGGRSRLEMTLPPHPVVSNKSTNTLTPQSAFPFCYLVNIRGDGIASTPSSCAPASGLNSGFREPSSKIEMDVPSGNPRTVELFGYIPRTGETCATAPSDLSAIPVNRLFKLGETPNVDMTPAEVIVTLEARFGGLNTHFGVSASLASSCFANLPPVTLPASNNSVPGVLIGNRLSLKAQIQGGEQPALLKSSKYSLKHEVKYVR